MRFSPHKLVFGHTVRGPLAAMQNDWKEAEPPQNLIDYVNGFRQRLHSAAESAKKKLASAPEKMKRLYDHRVYSTKFWLCYLFSTSFQAKFMGL